MRKIIKGTGQQMRELENEFRKEMEARKYRAYRNVQRKNDIKTIVEGVVTFSLVLLFLLLVMIII